MMQMNKFASAAQTFSKCTPECRIASLIGRRRPTITTSRAAASDTHVGSEIKASVKPLFTPFKLGRYELSHRMVYPPLTRNRGSEDNVPQPIMAEYYSQRATAGGLMIAEGTYTSADASGYPCAPGLWTKEQTEAWKPIVQAVHDKGAIFFSQLFHCGRASHPDLTNGKPPVGPSAIKINGQVYVGNGRMVDHLEPVVLDKAAIKALVADFRNAARNAIAAGFDGIEIHGANGYLVDQFTKSSSNTRTDEYGGSIENRCRFALEVVAAVVEDIGADKVGIRLSPFTDFLDAVDETPYGTFTYLVEQLNKHKLAYVHMIEARIQGNITVEDAADTLVPFRKVWKGPFITAGGFSADSGAAAVASGHADLVSYGRLWLSNPDLPKRFQLGAPLNRYDRNTFYAPGPQGYIDYPFLSQ